MPSRVLSALLFLSSYAPAFVIFAVRAYGRSCLMFIVTLSLAVLSVVAFILYIKVTRTGGPIRMRVVHVEGRDADLAAYVAAYLLPFVAIFGADTQNVIALALFLLFIGVLWTNSDLLYLNPLLALAGYHLFLAELNPVGAEPRAEGGSKRFVLAHRRLLHVGDELRVIAVGGSAYLEQENGESG